MSLPKAKQFEIAGADGKKVRIRSTADGVSLSSTPSNFVLLDEAGLADLQDALRAASVLVKVRRHRAEARGAG